MAHLPPDVKSEATARQTVHLLRYSSTRKGTLQGSDRTKLVVQHRTASSHGLQCSRTVLFLRLLLILLFSIRLHTQHAHMLPDQRCCFDQLWLWG